MKSITLLALFLVSCTWLPLSSAPKPADGPVHRLEQARNHRTHGYQQGKASWYSVRTNGKRTASGRPLDDRLLTAAHRSLPFGTKVVVRCRATGKTVVVEITDRGPYVRGRIIDLSRAAADKLGMLTKGITNVEICLM